jgi:hypothetical protein
LLSEQTRCFLMAMYQKALENGVAPGIDIT